MAFSNFMSYLKHGNKNSASENLNKPDKDSLPKVGDNAENPNKVARNVMGTNPDTWIIVDDDDDDVKVPITRKFQKTKSESLRSSMLDLDKDSDEYFVDSDLVEVKNDSLVKRLEDFENKYFTTVKGAGDNGVTEDDSEDSEDFDESFKVIGSDGKVEDKKLSSMIASFEDLRFENAELPLHLQPFYEPDKSSKPLYLDPTYYDSDSGSSIEVTKGDFF